MNESRRGFLLKLAKGAAYTAPVVTSLAAPDGLLGQGQSQNSQKGGMGKGMMMGMGAGATAVPDLSPQGFPTPTAPWATTPGGTVRPPGGE